MELPDPLYAIIKSLGQTISSEVVSNCTEVDGEFDCERNQSALLELNGDITSFKRIGKPKYGEEIQLEIRKCYKCGEVKPLSNFSVRVETKKSKEYRNIRR